MCAVPVQTEPSLQDGQVCAKRGDEPNASWTSELRLIISCPGLGNFRSGMKRFWELGRGASPPPRLRVHLSRRSGSCLGARVAWLQMAWGIQITLPTSLDAVPSKEAPSTAPHLTHRQPGRTQCHSGDASSSKRRTPQTMWGRTVQA